MNKKELVVLNFIKLREDLEIKDNLEQNIKEKERELTYLREKLESIGATTNIKDIIVQGGKRCDKWLIIIQRIISLEEQIRDTKKRLNNVTLSIGERMAIANKWNKRQMRIFQLRVEGFTIEQIAEELDVSTRTINYEIKKMELYK